MKVQTTNVSKTLFQYSSNQILQSTYSPHYEHKHNRNKIPTLLVWDLVNRKSPGNRLFDVLGKRRHKQALEDKRVYISGSRQRKAVSVGIPFSLFLLQKGSTRRGDWSLFLTRGTSVGVAIVPGQHIRRNRGLIFCARHLRVNDMLTNTLFTSHILNSFDSVSI